MRGRQLAAQQGPAALLARFGSLSGVLAVRPADLTKVAGVGETVAAYLKATAEIGARASLETLKAANVVRKDKKRARIMLSGEVGKALKVEDANVAVTKGARGAIEAAGGQVVDVPVPPKGRLVKKEKAAE